MEIGFIKDIAAREAWSHEAREFTPWLAANLGRLGEAIGIPLELKDTEVAVEQFSADILARNLHDDSLVLIENQLETTDHRHLGQIMTYLAGLEAKTVIWLATDFREPHLSAIKWLNEHTVASFSFFAVRLRVVRIGDSAAAPIFDVLARPSAWERSLQAIARKSDTLSETGEKRKAFWTAFLSTYPEHGNAGMVPTATSSNWVIIDPEGRFFISAWVGQAQIGLFLRGPRGDDGATIRESFGPYASEIETALGAPFQGDRSNTFLSKSTGFDLMKPEKWRDASDWLHGQIRTYLSELRKPLTSDRG